MQLWQQLDSVYSELAGIARLRAKTGESAGLDSLSANAKSQEIRVQLAAIQNEIATQQTQLQTLLNTDSIYLASELPLGKIEADAPPVNNAGHPIIGLQQQAVNIAKADLRVARLSALPEFSGRFFSQRLYGLSNPFSGYSITVGIPLAGLGNYKNRIRAAKLERDYQQTIFEYETISYSGQVQQARQTLEKSRQALTYYETTGLAQAIEILKAANLAYKGGEISFAELSQYLSQSVDIRKNHIEALHNYNQSALQLNYLLNR